MLKVLKKTYKRTQQKRRKKSCKIFDRGNCFLTESEDKQRRKRLSFFILILAGLLFVVPAVFLLKYRIQDSVFPSSEQELIYNQKVKTLSLLVYRHYVGYDEHCTKLGIPLTMYPSEFEQRFTKEISFLRQQLKEKGGAGLSTHFSQLRYQFSRVLNKTIQADFDEMRSQVATQKGIGLNELTDKEVCSYLEENAKVLLNDRANSNLERIQNLGIELITIK